MGEPPIEIEHEFIGKIRFMGGDTPADIDYWESELTLEGMTKITSRTPFPKYTI